MQFNDLFTDSKEDALRVRRLLARQLIDSGFKALAIKLHPDKGGPGCDMAILNEIRETMKSAATTEYTSGWFGEPRRRECLACGRYLEPRKRKCRSLECEKRGKRI